MSTTDKEAIKAKIIEQIKTVFDPEIPVDIYELGLIYKLEVDDHRNAFVEMTLTSPMCPVAESLPMEVQQKVNEVEGIDFVDLRVVWDPPWSKEMMSEEARFQLDMF
jgi:FeS assembly SUF system protein